MTIKKKSTKMTIKKDRLETTYTNKEIKNEK